MDNESKSDKAHSSNKDERKINIIEKNKITIKKFPERILFDKSEENDLDLNWKIPECLVIKFNNNDTQLAAGYTDGYTIIYNLKEENNSEKVKKIKKNIYLEKYKNYELWIFINNLFKVNQK